MYDRNTKMLGFFSIFYESFVFSSFLGILGGWAQWYCTTNICNANCL